MRLAARKDANHDQIVKAFRSMCCGWIDTYQFGAPLLDGLLEVNGVTVMVEIKDGSKRPSARKLTEGEEKTFATWRGRMAVISSIDEAIQLVNQVRQGLR